MAAPSAIVLGLVAALMSYKVSLSVWFLLAAATAGCLKAACWLSALRGKPSLALAAAVASITLSLGGLAIKAARPIHVLLAGGLSTLGAAFFTSMAFVRFIPRSPSGSPGDA